MPKIPKERKDSEDTGGGGNVNQTENRGNSTNRGGNPYRGGAGDKEKPKKK